MSTPPKISLSGFTIVRNATKLEYPFRESVLSILPICDELIINVGRSDDDTLEIARSLAVEFPKIKIMETEWKRDGQTGGFQLRSQTDAALAACRGDWCFYIQSDEVVHEEDLPRIRAAVERANARPEVKGIVFDWLHFYGSYHYVIRGRNWYRREVRIVRNHSDIHSFRDAQGFRLTDGSRVPAIESGARVFHYGYVRSSDGLRTKSSEMTQWWGEQPSSDPKAYQLVNHVGLTRFQGSHPRVMDKRLSDYQEHFYPDECARKWDGNEIKNAVTLAWEKVFHFRIGEFRNYEIIRG